MGYLGRGCCAKKWAYSWTQQQWSLSHRARRQYSSNENKISKQKRKQWQVYLRWSEELGERLRGGDSPGGSGGRCLSRPGGWMRIWELIPSWEEVNWPHTGKHTHSHPWLAAWEGDPLEISHKCPYRKKMCEEGRKDCIWWAVVFRMTRS